MLMLSIDTVTVFYCRDFCFTSQSFYSVNNKLIIKGFFVSVWVFFLLFCLQVTCSVYERNIIGSVCLFICLSVCEQHCAKSS